MEPSELLDVLEMIEVCEGGQRPWIPISPLLKVRGMPVKKELRIREPSDVVRTIAFSDFIHENPPTAQTGGDNTAATTTTTAATATDMDMDSGVPEIREELTESDLKLLESRGRRIAHKPTYPTTGAAHIPASQSPLTTIEEELQKSLTLSESAAPVKSRIVERPGRSLPRSPQDPAERILRNQVKESLFRRAAAAQESPTGHSPTLSPPSSSKNP